MSPSNRKTKPRDAASSKSLRPAGVARKKELAPQSFTATLERLRGNLGWVIIRIPFRVYDVWGARGMFRVTGEINGFAFRGSLFPTRQGQHFLLVNRRMQAGAGVRVGAAAELFLAPDKAERVAVVPPELQRIFSEEKALGNWFAAMNYSMRKWICDQIDQPRSADARLRRAEQIAETLYSAMEAESELPPAIRQALASEPRGLEGWSLMSPLRRRGNLMAIFHYRSPEARERRIAKVVAEASALAAKKPLRQKGQILTHTHTGVWKS